jgi:hypothetical protein
VFEGYTHEARQALVMALEEAHALRSSAIGTGHLLIGVIRSLPLLVPLRAEDVRARLGTGDAAEDAGLPFTDAAKRAIPVSMRACCSPSSARKDGRGAPAHARSRRGPRTRRRGRPMRGAGGVVRALCGKRSAMARGAAGTLVDWPMACQQQPIDSSSRRFRPKR